MKHRDEQVEAGDTHTKAPYERPELKKVGRLRDVTAQATPDFDEGTE